MAKWLSFMTSPEGMTLSNFGIEGVHYTKDDKGLITRTDKGIQDSKGQHQNGSGYLLAIRQYGIP